MQGSKILNLNLSRNSRLIVYDLKRQLTAKVLYKKPTKTSVSKKY